MESVKRGTGLLVIEAINSNPNGDPDRDNDPRILDSSQRGLITDKAIKRKLRDLVADKEGPVWQALAEELQLDADEYRVFVEPARDYAGALEAVRDTDAFLKRFWDVRVFGTTFLPEDSDRKEGAKEFATTGPFHFGMGKSIAPIEIERLTNTNVAPVERDRSRGMAPLAHRIVPHAVYVMPFYVNPTVASKTRCTAMDVEVALRVLPHVFSLTRSAIRPQVEVRKAWFFEHRSVLCSVPEWEIVDALTPKKKGDPDEPSRTWDDYEVPSSLPNHLSERASAVRDLVAG